MIGTLTDFRAYHTERGNAAPADATDADALAALVRASDYVTFSYVDRFASGYDETAPNVEPAVYEAAALELTSPGLFSATYTPSQQKVLTKVGDLQWTPIGAASGSEAAAPVSTRIEAMLRAYMLICPSVMVV